MYSHYNLHFVCQSGTQLTLVSQCQAHLLLESIILNSNSVHSYTVICNMDKGYFKVNKLKPEKEEKSVHAIQTLNCISDLRLQLLDTQHNYFLLKSLYGLLMLLPQSDAFTTLRNRLDCVPNGRVLSSDIR